MGVASVTFVVSVLLPAMICAKEFIVGDESGWNSDVDYYAWLEGKTFYVGDALVFTYDKDDHNVIKVNVTGYNECGASPNYGALDSGNDTITLRTPGVKYYICEWHCAYSDQKLMVTVLPNPILGAPIASSPLAPSGGSRSLGGNYWWRLSS